MAWVPPGVEVKNPEHWPLARGEVNHVGDPVAAILGDDRYAVVDAAEDVMRAVRPGSGRIDDGRHILRVVVFPRERGRQRQFQIRRRSIDRADPPAAFPTPPAITSKVPETRFE